MQCNTQQVNFRPVLFSVSALSIRTLAQLGKFLTDGLRIDARVQRGYFPGTIHGRRVVLSLTLEKHRYPKVLPKIGHPVAMMSCSTGLSKCFLPARPIHWLLELKSYHSSKRPRRFMLLNTQNASVVPAATRPIPTATLFKLPTLHAGRVFAPAI